MASIVIHMSIANELDKKLKRKNHNELMLGAIAPDISRIVGEKREESHFSDENDLPDLNKFIKKYKKQLNSDFILGYFIHLYTDYLWKNLFLKEFEYRDSIKYKDSMFLINGSSVIYDEDEFNKFLYNDYTNININLLDEYGLDLSLFYEPLHLPEAKVDEIPMERLQELLDYSGVIIKNSKETKSYVFDITEIKKFIDLSVSIIYSDILKLLAEEIKI